MHAVCGVGALCAICKAACVCEMYVGCVHASGMMWGVLYTAGGIHHTLCGELLCTAGGVRHAVCMWNVVRTAGGMYLMGSVQQGGFVANSLS